MIEIKACINEKAVIKYYIIRIFCLCISAGQLQKCVYSVEW